MRGNYKQAEYFNATRFLHDNPLQFTCSYFDVVTVIMNTDNGRYRLDLTHIHPTHPPTHTPIHTLTHTYTHTHTHTHTHTLYCLFFFNVTEQSKNRHVMFLELVINISFVISFNAKIRIADLYVHCKKTTICWLFLSFLYFSFLMNEWNPVFISLV